MYTVHSCKYTLLNIKGSNLNQFLTLHNILFLTTKCVEIDYFNSKHVIKKNHI